MERERRITSAARSIAEAEGWAAVTMRRLAAEIEYSQPVLYSHFVSRDSIVEAVAIEGFIKLAATIRQHIEYAADRRAALGSAAFAYLEFAHENSAQYRAMFTMPTSLRFAETDSRSELKEAFAVLASAMATSKVGVDVATEAFWAVLHGLAELERTGRIRCSAREARMALVVDAFSKC